MIDAAVIGLGRWGKNIVEAVQGKSRRLRIIRGVSKEPELVRDFAAAKGFKLSTEFEAAVADPRVRAVFLATPHSLHVGQISAVAAAGKPVWCEKPLALTRAEAARAIAATKKAGVPFALGNNKRCFPCMLKAAVDAAAIGGDLDAVLSVDTLKMFKPRPEVYRLVTDHFACRPADVTFVSSNRWDVMAGVSVGFRGVWINRAGMPDEYRDFPPARTLGDLGALTQEA